MEQTPNYHLNTPGYEEFGDVEVLNQNFDAIDTVLAGKADIQIGGSEPTGPGVVLWFADRGTAAQTLPLMALSENADGVKVRAVVDGKTYGVTNAAVNGAPSAACNYNFKTEEETENG